MSAFGRRAGLKMLGGSTVLASLFASRRALGLPVSSRLPDEILIGTLPINANVTFYPGAAAAFHEAGLKVKIITSHSGPLVVQAMIAGSVPIGDLGLAPALVSMSRGLPLVAPYLGGFETPQRPYERIMVRKDSPIHSLRDLKGKKIAILGRGSIADLVLSALDKDKAARIRKSDLKIVIIPPPNQPEALERGLVDAIFATPPSDTVAEKQGARTIANTTDIVPYLGFGTVMLRREFADTYPDATVRIFKAWIQFARWIGDHPAEAQQRSAAALHLPKDIASAIRVPYFSRNGLPVMANVWQVLDLLVASNIMRQPDDAAAFIHKAVVEPAQRFVLPAAEALGIQPDPAVAEMVRGKYPMLPKPGSAYAGPWEKHLLAG